MTKILKNDFISFTIKEETLFMNIENPINQVRKILIN